MAEEQRKNARFTVEGFGVNARTMFNTDVEIIDISIGGLSISCGRRLSIGSEYQFKFGHGDKDISVKGEVVWAKLTGSRKVPGDEVVPIYTFGIAFKDAKDHAEELADFVAHEIGEVRGRRLREIKVKLHAAEKAILTHMENCVVVELSVGGMRMEMEDVPSVGTVLALEIVVSEDERAVKCSGRVVFTNAIPGRLHDRYSVGMEFMHMVDEDKERLKRFLLLLPPTSL